MLNIRKGIKKLISYVMVFVLTVMVVGSAAVILSGIVYMRGLMEADMKENIFWQQSSYRLCRYQ